MPRLPLLTVLGLLGHFESAGGGQGPGGGVLPPTAISAADARRTAATDPSRMTDWISYDLHNYCSVFLIRSHFRRNSKCSRCRLSQWRPTSWRACFTTPKTGMMSFRISTRSSGCSMAIEFFMNLFACCSQVQAFGWTGWQCRRRRC